MGMTLVNTFVTNQHWMAVCQWALTGGLLYFYVKWIPHMYEYLNMVRISAYLTVFYVSSLFMMLEFRPGVDLAEDGRCRRCSHHTMR